MDGQFDEAERILDAALASDRLNLYEIAHTRGRLALVYAQRGDLHATRRLLRSTVWSDRLAPIEKDVLFSYEEQLFSIYLKLGYYYDSMLLYKQMLDNHGKKKVSHLTPVTVEIRALLSNERATAAIGQIALVAEEGGMGRWWGDLSKRSFSFDQIEGLLQDFFLICATRRVEAQVRTDLMWTLPDHYGGCRIAVRGTPGTTFRLIEQGPLRGQAKL